MVDIQVLLDKDYKLKALSPASPVTGLAMDFKESTHE